jgi:hypothetical protein
MRAHEVIIGCSWMTEVEFTERWVVDEPVDWSKFESCVEGDGEFEKIVGIARSVTIISVMKIANRQ